MYNILVTTFVLREQQIVTVASAVISAPTTAEADAILKNAKKTWFANDNHIIRMFEPLYNLGSPI
jgi:hypothetical protein